MSNRSRSSFLIGRFFRIYPAYWVASLIMLTILYLTRVHFFGELTIPGLTINSYISNMLLINNIIGIPSIDWINWTLAIEVKFYLVCFIFYAFLKKGNVFFIFICAFFTYSFIIFIPDGQTITLPFSIFGSSNLYLDVFKFDLLFIPFMFIGTLFFYAYKKIISLSKLFFLSQILLYIFYYMWSYPVGTKSLPTLNINYVYAFYLFYVCFMLREYFIKNKLLDFLADQTYMFYVLHGVAGYCLLKILYTLDIRYSIALIMTGILTLSVCVLLNVTVEKWAIAQGRKFK